MNWFPLRRFEKVAVCGGWLVPWAVGTGQATFFARDGRGNNRLLEVAAGSSAPLPGLPAEVHLAAVFEVAAGEPSAAAALTGVPAGVPGGCVLCDRPALPGDLTCGRHACPMAGRTPPIRHD